MSQRAKNNIGLGQRS